MNLNTAGISVLLARLAGLSILATDQSFAGYVTSLFGSHGTTIIAVIGLITTLAADLIHVQSTTTTNPVIPEESK